MKDFVLFLFTKTIKKPIFNIYLQEFYVFKDSVIRECHFNHKHPSEPHKKEILNQYYNRLCPKKNIDAFIFISQKLSD